MQETRIQGEKWVIVVEEKKDVAKRNNNAHKNEDPNIQ